MVFRLLATSPGVEKPVSGGFTPSQYSSGEHIRMGHITHAGNDRVRTTLVESSWILIGKDPHMRCKYEDIKQRRGGKKAVVAVARNLSIRIRRMLLDQVPYEIDFPKAAYKYSITRID
jgi:transposase